MEQLDYSAFLSCVSTPPDSPSQQRSPLGEHLPQNPLLFLHGYSLLHAEVPLLLPAALAIWVLGRGWAKGGVRNQEKECTPLLASCQGDIRKEVVTMATGAS